MTRRLSSDFEFESESGCSVPRENKPRMPPCSARANQKRVRRTKEGESGRATTPMGWDKQGAHYTVSTATGSTRGMKSDLQCRTMSEQTAWVWHDLRYDFGTTCWHHLGLREPSSIRSRRETGCCWNSPHTCTAENESGLSWAQEKLRMQGAMPNTDFSRLAVYGAKPTTQLHSWTHAPHT